MTHDEYCDELESEVARFADTLVTADLDAAVPSCPDWKVRDLVQHLGTVHRWAELLVRCRSKSRISFGDVKLGEAPYDDEWLRAGGLALAATLRSADPDEPMWAWGVDQHVRFWSRRQLHETLVHRVDLELAKGVTSEVSADVAVDAVDEFLANLENDRDVHLIARREHPDGERLQFRIAGGSEMWNVQLTASGFEFVDASPHADAVILADPAELLALLLRRRPAEECVIAVEGDRSLVDYWLSETAFL